MNRSILESMSHTKDEKKKEEYLGIWHLCLSRGSQRRSYSNKIKLDPAICVIIACQLNENIEMIEVIVVVYSTVNVMFLSQRKSNNTNHRTENNL